VTSPTATLTNLVIGDDEPRAILVVDDEDAIRLALARFLSMRGYTVHTAEDATSAMAVLRRERCSLLLCDVRMPGKSGIDLVPEALDLDPDLAIVMLTAVNDAPTAAQILARGAMDYLMKPIELDTLLQAVQRVMHRRDLSVERRNVERIIREEVSSRTSDLEREKSSLRQMTVQVVDALINAQEAKDQYLRGHSQRVAELAASMAEELGLNPDLVEEVRLAGRLHDVGKIGIRESVLNKPGALTAEEFEHVKEHVQIGVEILSPLRHLSSVLTYVLDHHEHWDGSGYPRGIAGDAISLGGRILCAADAFDAITSQRAWRSPMSPEATVEYLAGQAGTLLDPGVFDVLASVVRRRKALVFIDSI
jgi:putative two-component system response regulator